MVKPLNRKPMAFSKKVEELRNKVAPYIAPMGGLKPDAPLEVKKWFKEYEEQVEKEYWF